MDAPFSMEEVQQPINQMPSDKTPRPDAFTGIFFKKFWDVIEDNVFF
jgi:hypothetical protein